MSNLPFMTPIEPPKKPETKTTKVNLGDELPHFAKPVEGSASSPRPAAKFAEEPVGGLVKTWSPTGLQQVCEYRTFLKRVKRIKEPDSEAASRGSMIHDLGEHFVDGTIKELPHELEKFGDRFEMMKYEYTCGNVMVEQDWGFKRDWSPAEVSWVNGKPTYWGQMKLDLMHFESPTSALVVDYKTGKKYGNEFKHNQQGQYYTIGAFLRFPELEFIKTEFWYLDKGEELTNTYTRDQAMVFFPKLEQKADLFTRMMRFDPEPSINNCRWCSFKDTGECSFGV